MTSGITTHPLLVDLNARLDELKEKRQTFDAHWEEIRDFMLPFHTRGLSDDDATEPDDGSKRQDEIFNNTATRDIRTLASGMHSGLTSPARPWFRLATQDPTVMRIRGVKEWLYQVERLMFDIFSRSNVYKALHHLYAETCSFGTSTMAVEESDESVIHCRTYTCGEYYLGTDHNDRIDTFIRRSYMTARQIVNRWGENKVTSVVKSAYSNGSMSERFEVRHAVVPNGKEFGDIKEAFGREWASVYWEPTASSPLSAGGFEEFPIMAPRWNLPGYGVYGECPGFDALPDVKMLQKMEKKQLIALDKMVDPPTIADGSMKNDILNTLPGAKNFANGLMTGSRPGLMPLYQLQLDFEKVQFKINAVEQRVDATFYKDLFRMLDRVDREMTATEVAERQQERLLQLGPVLENLHDELLSPLIDRTFAIAARQNLLPPAPPALQGQTLKVVYNSILAQAQKQVGMSAINQFAGFVGNLAQVVPEALDKIDVDEAVDSVADTLGVPPNMVRDEKEVTLMRQQRAEEARRQQALEQAESMGRAAKDMGKAKMDEGTVLDPLLAAMGVGQ